MPATNEAMIGLDGMISSLMLPAPQIIRLGPSEKVKGPCMRRPYRQPQQ
jgi:hypothetical protein